MGQICTESGFRRDDLDPWHLRGQPSCLRNPHSQLGHIPLGLEWILRADKPPDLIKAQCLPRQARNMQMSVMRRVERAAKEANPQSVAIMKQAGMRVTIRGDSVRQV